MVQSILHNIHSFAYRKDSYPFIYFEPFPTFSEFFFFILKFANFSQVYDEDSTNILGFLYILRGS